MRLLLVEDNEDLGDALERHFRAGGHAVDWAHSAPEADDYLRAGARGYDLVILDIMLPGGDGREILQRIRTEESDLPVLVLTARSQVADRVHLLDLGADDYMTKPFDVAELDARCRAVVRRRRGQAQSLIQFGALELDAAAASVTSEGRPLDLRSRELRLLEVLISQPGQVFSKSQLMDKLFGLTEDASENAIEVYIGRLRRKIQDSGVVIETVRGLGYRLREGQE
ncbi:response regulator transcription factor [Pelagibius litoralis]|uniref:Response regulator transcription factor n=1 Tax=Pelagibius litoralis TaxID=374515 RepID=A0A967KAU4_9PROT|nr:response regulator transcription factor [Pelagibius litoralis]NIA70034.1 response regulator transcription factor [Pelagibius litoralis]